MQSECLPKSCARCFTASRGGPNSISSCQPPHALGPRGGADAVFVCRHRTALRRALRERALGGSDGCVPQARLHLKQPGVLVGRVARVLGAVGLVFAVLCGRALYSTNIELDRADSLREGGNNELALDHYRRAATWTFPGNVARTPSAAVAAGDWDRSEARGESRSHSQPFDRRMPR